MQHLGPLHGFVLIARQWGDITTYTNNKATFVFPISYTKSFITGYLTDISSSVEAMNTHSFNSMSNTSAIVLQNRTVNGDGTKLLILGY